MKNHFLFLFYLFTACILFIACNNDSSTPNTVVMDAYLTDMEDNLIESYPINEQNMVADTILRSTKLYDIKGDSIVLSNLASEFKIHITTNASWRISKQKAWGSNSSITWLANPKPIFGGGNSVTMSSVRANTSKTDRRAYLYITTGDSACMKKYVILQKGNY